MHPTLYQLSARLWLGELGERLGRPATFDDVEDEELDQFALRGFDFLWVTGVWQTGPYGRRISAERPDCVRAFREELPDCTEADVCGSPFAVTAYSVHADFGGNTALAGLRDRLRRRGLRLMLDYVPNHTAVDHPWVASHPEYYIEGSEDDVRREPQNYVHLTGPKGGRILAHGRDPYFDGWTDTVQLNYRHSGLREAMIGELTRIAAMCDGVRCDMAMLLLPNVFQRTWGERSLPRDGSKPNDLPFWPEAIARTRQTHGDFTFLSEVYWDLEATLQAQGFDFTYDKSLYDRLRSGSVEAILEHLAADAEFQRRSARFLENHDEPRAAAVFANEMHRAAAVVAYGLPGLRFFHDGQLDGRRTHASVHLARRVRETSDPVLRDFYGRLLPCLNRSEFRRGAWRLLERRAAWSDNFTFRNFIAYEWRADDGRRSWVVVNYGPTQGQCYVDFADPGLRGRTYMLRDQLSRAWYERDGNELADRGLYLDLPAWGYHLFDVTAT